MYHIYVYVCYDHELIYIYRVAVFKVCVKRALELKTMKKIFCAYLNERSL